MDTQHTTNPADLAGRAMLARLTITQWTGRKQDKRTAAKVADDHGAARDRIQVHKALVAKSALDNVKKAAAAARAAHYEITLPWTDDGARILPAAAYGQHQRKLARLYADFTAAVDEFCQHYADYRDRARLELNSLFNCADYPHPAAIRHRFSFACKFAPLPLGRDFRTALAPAEVEQIRRDLETETADAISAATRDLYERAQDVLSSVIERLQSKDPKTKKTRVFRDSLIGNVARLVEILPALNVTADPHLDEIRRDMQARIAHLDPQTLRDSAPQRAQTVKDAAAILAKLSAYTGTDPPPALANPDPAPQQPLEFQTDLCALATA